MKSLSKEILKSFLGLSIFRRPKIKAYFGKIRLGAPLFYPRRWVKTPTGYTPVDIKWFGIKVVGLGFKTKWASEDIRYEWPPSLHIIFMKLQLAFWLMPKHPDQYWKAMILYTDLDSTEDLKVKRVFDYTSFVFTKNNDRVDTKDSIFVKSFLKKLNE